MNEIVLGIFKSLLENLIKVSKESETAKNVMLAQMEQTAELRKIIRDTRLAVQALDAHLIEIEYYKKHGMDGPFSLVKKAIEPAEKWL